jgi:hypothetical protein
MTAIIVWITTHQVLATTLAWLFFSAAIDSLPTPSATSTGFYSWFYKFTNVVAMNLSKMSVPSSTPVAPKV